MVYLLVCKLADDSPAAKSRRLLSSDTTTHQDSTKPKVVLSTVKIPGVTVKAEAKTDTMKRYIDSLISRAKKADTLEALMRHTAASYRVAYEDTNIRAVVYCEPITHSAVFDTLIIKPIHYAEKIITNTVEVEEPVPWYDTPTAVVFETLGAVYLVSEVSTKLRGQ
jgi:hypothetical protein